MSILNYFKKMLGFQTQETTPELPTVETAVVAETTCPVERIYEISPEPLQLESEPTVVNPQITDAVTEKDKPNFITLEAVLPGHDKKYIKDDSKHKS